MDHRPPSIPLNLKEQQEIYSLGTANVLERISEQIEEHQRQVYIEQSKNGPGNYRKILATQTKIYDLTQVRTRIKHEDETED